MKLPTDRITIAWMSIGACTAVGIAGAALLVPWVLREHTGSIDDAPWTPPNPTEQATAPDRVNPSDFNVVLWHDEPADVPVHEEPAQPRIAVTPEPPPLTLVGIVTETIDGSPIERAALYDSANDEIVFAKVGDAVASGRLDAIERTGVVVTLSDWIYRMPLDGEPDWTRHPERTP
ncbi:MAG: hypothetical protein AAGB48_08510 [Planctomycetota bacterium]